MRKEQPEVKLRVKNREDLEMIQELLRRKWCELGFEEKYIRLRELGRGATSRVHLVERKSDGLLFAAKVISLKTSSNKEYVLWLLFRILLRIRQRY